MTKNDKVKFAQAFLACCLVFDKPVNEEQMRVYFDLLSDCQIDDVCKAFRKHVTDPDRGRFFPKVADIVYQIEQMKPKQDARAIAELEWYKVFKAASQGRKPNTDDQYTLAALQLIGGPRAVGYAESRELSSIKQAFISGYAALQSASVNALPDHLENIELIKQAKTGMVKT